MTGKDDDFADIRAAFDAASPRPDPDRKAADLALARKNFDALQGSRDQERSNPARPASGLWRGARKMLTTLKTRGALTATTAIAACGLFLLTPAGQDMLRPLADPGALTEATAGRTEEAQSFDAPQPPAPVMMEPAPLAAPAERSRAVADMEVANGIARSMPQANEGLGIVPAFDDRVMVPEPNTEAFANEAPSGLLITAEAPVSTFSIDVDTASYALVRQMINAGSLPPPDAVRIEEMINYFPYDLPAPDVTDAPFLPSVSVYETPWNPDTRLVHIGIQGTLPDLAGRPPLNLVFLIDTSGSMNDPAKLPLLKQSFRLMLDELRPEDEVAIVEYAGSAGLVLPATRAADRTAILAAIDGLGAGGATNGQGGLEQAYDVADAMAEAGEVSRVILATDGDFNVGLSGIAELERFIADRRETGTFLSVLGFGRGNLDDATMQALAQNGNGTAAYIDTLSEAQKVLVDQLTGTLFTIASDVKVQVEFNPAAVAEYRLIGYETRALRREDFNNDRVDAGDLGAGHSVTALYEITPVGSPARLTDSLRYGPDEQAVDAADELGFLRLRWKAPGEEASQLIETLIPTETGLAGQEALFATAIAGFGQLLRDPSWLGDWGWDDAIALAADNRGDDPFGYRNEALRLMRIAQSLSSR
ncbi:VWA domain-containing protein [Ponticoccus sp. SC2-23]|uniref:vWA domain-containing protein n=1 Tax=Alexandriicola marinus TaxID=2081710 RepID=UPI000FD743C9|nr:VWA domain-containing protein [Alexandriicola marinus]MBM1222201.1 VWA domain-containing protein [Ponticoccus sp. SC6-9]MBM1226888.1 VWA domain-containing protein [Ponticoccus sp. SC6-15]MBM1231148.1 VWA domain-containing protein [Ponticoccus sp. SC6-38]MBM1235600.1 VWA domain-containing protein [Ponticoccus sp. SC6-45]MBM1240170.1 VWA domain-containing protein [Ponticoccus sp. SC6-49]MBM1244524.1 VWA domain-containing protein [Ponticoccus sp. SC2-64]MBM1249074.1 VWA domain-containing pro